ncbi:MAG: biopolymer transport protein ExbD [Thermotogaceae bacterium]|jgi:biopolymer transport protein ExbD|nr:biopolymer transport protein ExbD [Thermotogaceae bacterium]MDN5337328.1 biopolymer transport protein ExbD [Thermotogaceae bacterium]
MKRRNARLQSIVIEITPLIDVIFLLLLFFVLTTTFVIEEKAIEINLPEAQTGVSETIQEKRLIVSIDSDDRIYFNGKRISINDLNYEIEKYLSTQRTNTAYITADKTAHYGIVVRIMDIFRAYKITDLKISVKEIEK